MSKVFADKLMSRHWRYMERHAWEFWIAPYEEHARLLLDQAVEFEEKGRDDNKSEVVENLIERAVAYEIVANILRSRMPLNSDHGNS